VRFDRATIFEFADVAGGADEGEGEVIDGEFEAELDVGDVLFGQGGQAALDAGEVDVARLPSLPSVRISHSTRLPFFGGGLILDGAVVQRRHRRHGIVEMNSA